MIQPSTSRAAGRFGVDNFFMPKDVDQVLHEVAATHGGLMPEGAVDYVNPLRRDTRYLRYVY